MEIRTAEEVGSYGLFHIAGIYPFAKTPFVCTMVSLIHGNRYVSRK